MHIAFRSPSESLPGGGLSVFEGRSQNRYQTQRSIMTLGTHAVATPSKI